MNLLMNNISVSQSNCWQLVSVKSQSNYNFPVNRVVERHSDMCFKGLMFGLFMRNAHLKSCISHSHRHTQSAYS